MKKLQTGLILLCAFLSSNCFAQVQPLFTGAIGIQSYTYRNSYPNGVAAVLDSVKALGITEMEGPNPKSSNAAEFKKLLNERNISMPSIGVDYNLIIKDPEAVVKQARFFGATYVMVAWIPHGKTFTLDDANRAIDDFNRVGKVLYDNGITFCYHNHGYEFGSYGDGTLFDHIAERTDPKYVSFEMDVLWAFHGGADPAKLLHKYKDRWKLMHLKDIRKGVANDLTGGTDTKNDVALGTGQINLPEVLKAAKAVGIKHYFIEDESPDHAAQIPVTIAYLKSLKD
ncbi:sugar phosphate isomerase/epimerase family protein [Mucilaginibacter sp.]|uniref:sugar phosphate isomerase/epimerase family protein n=1 Tax=Mucilaginibacter sp. TaxID=1882438 RepID=UPI003D122258